MNNDLISRDALKKSLEELKKSPWYCEHRDTIDGIASYQAQKEALQIVENMVDNAPIIDLVSPTIKVNIPEGTKQKLIEELQKPHKLLVLPEPEVTFERLQGEWKVVSRNCWKCPYCQELTNEGKNFCPNCGAKMRGGKEEDHEDSQI